MDLQVSEDKIYTIKITNVIDDRYVWLVGKIKKQLKQIVVTLDYFLVIRYILVNMKFRLLINFQYK